MQSSQNNGSVLFCIKDFSKLNKIYSIKYDFLNWVVFNFFKSFIKILGRIGKYVLIKCFLIFNLFKRARFYFSVFCDFNWIEITQYRLSFMNNYGPKSWKKQLWINEASLQVLSHLKLFLFNSFTNFIEFR